MPRNPQFRVALLTTLTLALVGCGAESQLSSSVSKTLFDDANAELHRIHLDAFELEDWPASTTYECTDGGTIEMSTLFKPDGSFEHLGHIFVDCKLGDLTLSGNLDYLNISRPDCNGVQGLAYDIDGDLEITGTEQGDCSIRAQESCGDYSGSACGYDLFRLE